jgi:tRNA threonylcarbamoyladenosine biosynthesis protein TsaE
MRAQQLRGLMLLVATSARCATTLGSRIRTAPRRLSRVALSAQADAPRSWEPGYPAQRRARWPLPDAEATMSLGRSLARMSKPGDVILLAGEVGMGKSTLARGFLKEMRRDELLQVSSPSYLLDITYPDPEGESLLPGVTVHHMDLWRLAPGQIAALVDLTTTFVSEVSLIEWPDRLAAAAPDAHRCLLIEIEAVEPAPGAPTEPSAGEDEEEDEEEERCATMSTYGEGWSSRIEMMMTQPLLGDDLDP